MTKTRTRTGLPAHVKLAPSGTYSYRRRVPDHLREPLGKREIKKSLGRDYAQMLAAHAKIEAEVDALFSGGRTEVFLGAVGPKRRPANNMRNVLISLLRDHDIDPHALTDIAKESQEQEYSALDNLVDILADHVEEAERQGKAARITADMIRNLSAGKLPDLTLRDILIEYRDALNTGRTGPDRQLANRIENLLRRLQAHLGDKAVNEAPATQIHRRHITGFKEYLLRDLAPSSVQRTFNILKAAINRAIDEHELDWRNPVARQKLKGAGNGQGNRLPLDERDMSIADPHMDKTDDLGLIWALLRDTGARLSEIAVLRVKDVNLEDRLVKIEGHDERGLKTANSEREVPIPNEVVDRLRSRVDRANDPEGAVFRQYSKYRGGDAASQALMKRLRKYIKDKRKVIHSLRHRMKDKLREDCPEHIAREIMGHASQGIAADYGRGVSLRRKREELQKVWTGI